MALSIDTCNDIEKYQEAVVAGLNAKKSIYMGLALLCGGGVSLILILFVKMHPLIGVYAATPVSFTVMMLGLYEKDGMNAIQLLKSKLNKNQNKPIPYVSTESKQEYEKHKKEAIVQTKEQADAEFNKIMKLFTCGAIGIVALIIIVIVLLVVLL